MNEDKPHFLTRWNKWYAGLTAGIVFPLFLYFTWWLFFVEPSEKMEEGHIRYGFLRELNLNVLRLCVGMNLVWFYFFLNRKLYEWVKGIIAAVVAYILLFLFWLYVDDGL